MTSDTFDRFTPLDRGLFGDNEQAPPRNRVSGASDLHDFTLVLHATRPSSVYVSRGDITTAVWLPRSQIQLELVGAVERKKNGRTVQPCLVKIPRWLAIKKGLL